jgi:hypothetical protein
MLVTNAAVPRQAAMTARKTTQCPRTARRYIDNAGSSAGGTCQVELGNEAPGEPTSPT